jgi:hypothetical protein
MAIAINYIGERRFEKSTKQNHAKMISELSKEFDIKVYNFVKDNPNPSCPYKLSGSVQVWDFYSSARAVPEDIVIKIRTDLWFTDSSILVLKEELRKVVDNKLDVVFLGIDLRNHYDKQYCLMELTGSKSKCTDFVIIANKNTLTPLETITNHYDQHGQEKSGNRAFKAILRTDTKFLVVSCQMYLLRKDYDIPSSYEILSDWVQEYRKTVEARDWIAVNKKTIGRF